MWSFIPHFFSFFLLHTPRPSHPTWCDHPKFEKYKSRNSPWYNIFSIFTVLPHSFPWRNRPPSGTGPSHYRSFTITLGRTALDEWSARRLDHYLTTHNTHNNTYAPSGIRTRNSSKRQTADRRFIPCGHWDPCVSTWDQIFSSAP